MDPDSINLVFALFDCFGAILYELLIAGLMDPVYQSDAYEAFPGVLVNRGKRAFTSGEHKKGQILRGTKTIFGNRKNKKTYFQFGVKREQANLFQRNKGTGSPPLPERDWHITEATLYRQSNVIPYYLKFTIVIHSNDVRRNASVVQVICGESQRKQIYCNHLLLANAVTHSHSFRN